MPTLILLNGAPASGKSTLARLLAEDRQFTLVVDIDTLRGVISGWERHPIEAGLMARRLAGQMCNTHLAEGNNVIVPQFLQRADYIEELSSIAGAAGARFLELCLVNSPEQAVSQFEQRGTSNEPNHQAAKLLQSAASATPIAQLHQGLFDMVADRPQTLFVTSVPEDIDQTLAVLRTTVSW